jgi:hypothetical protein
MNLQYEYIESQEKVREHIQMEDGRELKVSAAMTHNERQEIFMNQDKYLNRWIEFKGMEVGSKNVPRHPTFLRFREDKN